MKIESQNKTLFVTELAELAATSAAATRDAIRGALAPQHTTLLIDLSQVCFLDSSGLGALIALHKTLSTSGGQVQLLNPTPAAQQVLELTRLHRILEIVRR